MPSTFTGRLEAHANRKQSEIANISDVTPPSKYKGLM